MLAVGPYRARARILILETSPGWLIQMPCLFTSTRAREESTSWQHNTDDPS